MKPGWVGRVTVAGVTFPPCENSCQATRRSVGTASARKNTPAEVVDKLNNEINAVLADPTNKARLIGLGADPILMTSSDFGKFMFDETKKWEKVIRESNIKPD